MRARIQQSLVVAAAVILLLAGSSPRSRAADEATAVDINTASVAELTTLPGIGESKAKAIVEYRGADPFRSVDDLKKVQGIGDKTFEVLRPHITVGGGEPRSAAAPPAADQKKK